MLPIYWVEGQDAAQKVKRLKSMKKATDLEFYGVISDIQECTSMSDNAART
jgi:hypothetical protein